MRFRCLSATTFILALGIAFPPAAAGQPDTLWSEIYDGDIWEVCCGIAETEDGGFAIAGDKGPAYWQCSFWLMRTDPQGNLLWSNTYSDTAGRSTPEQLLLLDEGRFLLAGWVDNGSSWDIRLVMVNGSGQMEWNRVIGEENRSEFAMDALCTEDGGFVITGGWGNMNYEQILLMKTDSLGNVEWESHFDLNKKDYGCSVQQTADGGYVIGGYTEYNDDSYDCAVIKTDSAGNAEWTSIFDFGWPLTWANEVHETPGGNYIGLAHELIQFHTVIFKLDEFGELLWESEIEVGETTDFNQMPDGGHLHTGFVEGKGAVGLRRLGSAYPAVAACDPRELSPTGGSGCAGRGSAIFIMRTDSMGNAIWHAVYSNSSYYNHGGGFVCETSDGGSFAVGVVQPGAGVADIWMLRFGECTGLEEQQAPPAVGLDCACNPNPFGSTLQISYRLQEASEVSILVYDSAGHLVFSRQLPRQSVGTHLFDWTPSENTPSGCYIVAVEAGGRRETRRCIRTR